MTRSEIQALQARIGVEPDGFWGPQSIAACQAHLRRLMPQPNPWPSPRELDSFYGAPDLPEYQAVTGPRVADRLRPIRVAGLGVEFGGSPVGMIWCHELVADSLERALRSIAASGFAWVLQYYAGCYNARVMRGGTRPSVHAYGAAIDFWPARNGNRVAWPVSAAMPIQVMEMFAAEGWCPAGAFWGRDAMHFQATS